MNFASTIPAWFVDTLENSRKNKTKQNTTQQFNNTAFRDRPLQNYFLRIRRELNRLFYLSFSLTTETQISAASRGRVKNRADKNRTQGKAVKALTL